MIDMHMRNICERTSVAKAVVKECASGGMGEAEVRRMLEEHLSSQTGQLTDDHVQNKLTQICDRYKLKVKPGKVHQEV